MDHLMFAQIAADNACTCMHPHPRKNTVFEYVWRNNMQLQVMAAVWYMYNYELNSTRTYACSTRYTVSWHGGLQGSDRTKIISYDYWYIILQPELAIFQMPELNICLLLQYITTHKWVHFRFEIYSLKLEYPSNESTYSRRRSWQ